MTTAEEVLATAQARMEAAKPSAGQAVSSWFVANRAVLLPWARADLDRSQAPADSARWRKEEEGMRRKEEGGGGEKGRRRRRRGGGGEDFAAVVAAAPILHTHTHVTSLARSSTQITA